jgi:hypothetical protein
MQSRRPSEEAAKMAEEAKTILQAISSSGQGLETKWRRALRASVAEEVEQLYLSVIREIDRKKRIGTFLEEKEPWAASAPTSDRKGCLVQGDLLKKESAWYIAYQMRLKRNAVYLPLDDFKQIIEKLKESILEGDLDAQLNSTVEQLVHHRMIERIDGSIT